MPKLLPVAVILGFRGHGAAWWYRTWAVDGAWSLGEDVDLHQIECMSPWQENGKPIPTRIRDLWGRLVTGDDRVAPSAADSERGELVCEGKLVRLRRHVASNREDFQRWYADPDIARLLRHDLKPLAEFQSGLYFDSVILPGSMRGQMFAIHDAITDRLIGTTGITDLDHGSPGTCYFRIVIGESKYWGQGRGTETTRLVLHEAFSALGRTRVQLEVFSYNERAFHAYERVGFRKTGEHIEWPGPGEGELHVLEMQIEREAFLAKLRDQTVNPADPPNWNPA
jgi:RimJ/RimL family protein N-acetyltransferase